MTVNETFPALPFSQEPIPGVQSQAAELTRGQRAGRFVGRPLLALAMLTGGAAATELSNAPLAHADTGIEYTVGNTDGGVFARESPHTADTQRVIGDGIYDGDTVELICGVTNGDPVGPYNNTTWHYVQDLSRPSEGDFWTSDHYVLSPNVADQLAPGEATCGGDENSSGGGSSSPSALPCSPFLLIGARGSGDGLPGAPYTKDNNMANTSGLGPTPAPIADSLSSYYGSNQIEEYGLPYQAAPATALIGDTYEKSETQGEDMLADILNAQMTACPNQKFFLAGYSQGGEIIGNVVSKDAAIAGRVAGVAILGDPRFNPSSSTARGNFNNNLRGILGARPEFPQNIAAKVGSYCSASDAICNYTLAGMGSFADGSSPHFHYPDSGLADAAAGFLESLERYDVAGTNFA